jgi:hypothetical protein
MLDNGNVSEIFGDVLHRRGVGELLRVIKDYELQ